MKKIYNIEDLVGLENGFGLVIEKNDNKVLFYDYVVFPASMKAENYVMGFSENVNLQEICTKLLSMGFSNIEYKGIDVALLFKNNCGPCDFCQGELNDYLYFDDHFNEWRIITSSRYILGGIYFDFSYFEERSDKGITLVNQSLDSFLNENHIHPKQVFEALKSLGWLGLSNYTK